MIMMPSPSSRLQKWLFVLLILIFFVTDRALKEIYFYFGHHKNLFYFLDSGLFLNRNFIFGIVSPSYLMAIVFAIFFIFLIWQEVNFWQKKSWVNFFAFGLIIAGAFSNLLDRFFYGAVIDYWQMRNFNIFNLADIMIVAGLIIFVFNFSKNKESK